VAPVAPLSSAARATRNKAILRPRRKTACIGPSPLAAARIWAYICAASMPALSLHTPLGPLTVSEEDGCIVALDWGWGSIQTETPLLRRAADQLQDYADGTRRGFDLPLAPHGSAYRQRVWAALRTIPYGQTRSYAEIAALAGGSPRSVGGANGANPIPIIIPCHRVTASNGIGGYSGGDGIATKTWLLALERSDDHAGHSSQGQLPEHPAIHRPRP
jgi:methylated-DNA-[protein]-cysteine S-methyltransferase